MHVCKAHSRSHVASVHFFVTYFLFFPPFFSAPLFLAKEKRWHPDCGLRCQLFFNILMLRGGRAKSRDRVKTTALPASSLFFCVHLLSLLVPTFTLLAVFPSTSPFSLAFLFHSSTQTKMVSAILMKDYLVIQWETVSNRERILTASSISGHPSDHLTVILLCVSTVYESEGHRPLAVAQNDFSLLSFLCEAETRWPTEGALGPQQHHINKRFLNRF